MNYIDGRPRKMFGSSDDRVLLTTYPAELK